MDFERPFIYGLVVFVLGAFIIRAAMDYKTYKKTINPYLYSNYIFDYYWHYFVARDNSKSALLTQEIGNHRMIFAQIADANNVVVSRFVTVIHSHGVTLISYFNPNGQLTGSDKDKKWVIKRTENENIKKYAIENPFAYLRTYEAHLKDATGVDYVDKIIAIGGEEQFKVNVPCKLVRYKDLITALKSSDAGYVLSMEEIEDLFTKLKESTSKAVQAAEAKEKTK